jgi:hypothetical protein
MKNYYTFFLTFLITVLIANGCYDSDKKDKGERAPGSGKSGEKIDFKYDARAAKEWLRITKGQREGALTDIYVGDTKIGSLYYGTIVQKIGEERGWYKIRYYNQKDGEFFGFIKYTDAEPATKPREQVVIKVGEDAEPTVYKFEEVEEKLSQILKVPYKLKVIEEQPEVKTEKVFASAGTPDGYDDLTILKKFKNDSQSYVYADSMIKELEKLYERAPKEYKLVIYAYGKALLNYKDKNMKLFENYLDEAVQKREYYRKSFQ